MAEDVLEQEPRHIAERASDVGEERLDRTNLDILLTALIGRGEVSLGGLAAMAVVGSLLVAPRPGQRTTAHKLARGPVPLTPWPPPPYLFRAP